MKKKSKIVKDAAKWDEMAGANDLEKAINSYLTQMFVTRKNVPADECLKETKEILRIIDLWVCNSLCGHDHPKEVK